MPDSRGLQIPGLNLSLMVLEALHILRERKDDIDRKLILKYKY